MAGTKLEINAEIPSVSKQVTQASINQFESCGILDRENIHNNPEIAAQRLGFSAPIASGRMSVAFAAESLRKFFGPQVFNHTGTVNLKFLRPVKHGDTITVSGTVKHQERVKAGTLVTVDIFCENQDREQTAVGVATAII
jgi:3-hydroxybutyryl-CoA dehydratase